MENFLSEKVKQSREKLTREKGRLLQLETTLDMKKDKRAKLQEALEDIEQAREIARIVAQETQQLLECRIADLVSLALSSVFEDPYGFVVEFTLRRGKTECDLFFERGGNRLTPTEAGGIGQVDVAAFALRIALWSLERPRRRNVLILDEPFKHLRGESNQKKCGAMLKEISDELNIQMIIVGDVLFSIAADKIFEVTLKNGISEVCSR